MGDILMYYIFWLKEKKCYDIFNKNLIFLFIFVHSKQISP